VPIHLCHAEVESRLGVKGLKKLVWRSCLILGSAATLSPGLVAAEAMAPAYTVSVVTDRTDALYHVGETATFVIRVLHHGQPLGEADVQWRISKNGETTIEQGSIRLENGEARVSASLSEPGFLQCRVAFQAGGAETVALAGAGVDPQDIAPSLPVPDDFDAFWASKKALLAEIPMNPRMVPVSPSAKGFEIFDVQADSIGGVPVSGYFVRPADAEPGSLPAILTLHGAGVRSAGIPTGWAKEGMLAMDINAHGVPNGKPAAYYDGLVTGSLSRYSMRGRDSRDTYYFLGMFLRSLPPPGTRVQLNGNNLHVIADQSLVAGEWYPLSVTFSLPDEVQRLQVNIFNWLGNGTVWFDDVHLEATTFDWIAYQETAMRELEARELEGPSMLTTLHDQHPRLLVSSSDLAHLRQLIENEPQAREWYTALKISATNVLFQPVSQYEIPDGKRLLATSRRVLDRVLLLAFVYHMEEDVRFAERAWKELEAAAHFPDWNPSHFLDTAEMTHAFAIGYDWLYHVWTPEQRDVLRNAIAHMGLEPGLHAYRGTAPYGWWVNVTHNWNLVCNGGLAMGALAIADEEPRLAELILRAGIKSAPAAIAQFAPDGGWDEGVGYWHYSIRYLIPTSPPLRAHSAAALVWPKCWA
jgi:hypothetical protein